MSGYGRVAVVGAGWAGLACAAQLAASQTPVTVFEAARQPGGRARTVTLNGLALDNGQHLLVGAYTEILQLMRLVGARPDRLLARSPLHLLYPGHFALRLPSLPAPLHLAIGLLRARGATIGEKLSAARFMSRLQRQHFKLAHDTTVSQWLDDEGQRGAIRRHLWEPLCLAALNTLPADASAQIFANVLRDSLGGDRRATDLLLPACALGELLPSHAVDFIHRQGGEVRLSTRIDALVREENGWQLAGEHFDHVVIAVAPQHLASLLSTREAHETLLTQMAGYTYEPIGTAYLAYPANVSLPAPMLGLAGPIGQWVFDRGAIDGHAGVLAFVLSGTGEWDKMEDDDLAARLHDELCGACGTLPAPLWHRVIRERRATFSCRPDLYRPPIQTAERGLWLAGDYTWADYPATLEGAVRSGASVARAILRGR